MEILEVVIQGLEKKAKEEVIRERFRDTLSDIDERMQKLSSDDLKVYGRNTNNYGTFDSDHATYTFPPLLSEYYSGQKDLVKFSQETCRKLASEMTLHATGGYVCFLRYSNQGREWLLIVVLKLKTATGIDPKTLVLNESLAFDINNLHEAARIDLSKWSTNTQPYLSFVKSSKRQDDVTRYFRKTLGCTEYTDSKTHTDNAMNAIVSFCKENSLNADRIAEVKSKAYEYFDAKRASGEPANLTALSAIINDQDPSSFADFVREHQIEINEAFDPHKKTYSRFKRISGKFGNISVAFNLEDVSSGLVDYDSAKDMLIINKPSSSIIDSIKQAKGDDTDA